MARLLSLITALSLTASTALASGGGGGGDAPEGVLAQIDAAFGGIVGFMAGILFAPVATFDVAGGDPVGLPLIVVVLLFGGVFFTFFHGWLNVRGFKHAIDVTRGVYDNPDDPGEISHFQALTSALSATVGLGNIAGVAVAIAVGGPGAVPWMILLGIFGMAAKFNECTLAQMYRRIDADGTVHGGPMYYLEIGLPERGVPPIVGKIFAVVFALFCVGGSFGGGNMFQSNQATKAIANDLLGGVGSTGEFVIGIILAILVGLVIIGGIKRIGQVTEKVIPVMCGIYIVACVVVLFSNASAIPGAFADMFGSALSMEAGFGGFVGIAVQGIKRAVFSNEAGVGSAAIAHSAAKTDEPVREGVVAMLGPFIDTVVICTMTALVVIVSGAYQTPEAGKGVEMTSWAFGQTAGFFPYVLSVSVFLFALSTMISWSYYGEKAWYYLAETMGLERSHNLGTSYRVIYLGFIVLGAVASLGNVVDFSDLMILSMAFPNIIGGVILAPKVKELLTDYWGRYEKGEFKTYK